MRNAKYMLIGALSLLAAPALADNAQRDLSVEQTTVAQAPAPYPSSLQIQVTADRADATYAVGETVRLTVSTSEDAYVTVLDVGPTGQVVQLFPNMYQTDNHLVANRPVEIAPAGSGARVTVNGAVGAELIKVIASSKPVAVVSESQLQGRGAFRSVEGGASALLRDLQVVADQAAQGDTKVTLGNFTLRTVGSRLGQAPSTPALVVVPGQAPTLPVTTSGAPLLVGMPGQQSFPLLLATDKPAYRIGEKVTVAVTSLAACNLTVLDVATSGQVRTLFPNAATPNNAVAANQTVLVSGGASPASFIVQGPIGAEQILAFCTTDAAPLWQQAAGDRAGLTRDLAVVATRPVGTTASASVTFIVQQ